jgi:pentatricopeptide repeat domain-containing protein 1
MVQSGVEPNTTTYNALISAYGKAGRTDKVMEIYHEMVEKGCERTVITYSSLIHA